MLYPEKFDIWWGTYPRKVSKKNAYNAWRRIPDKIMPIVDTALAMYKKKWEKENTPMAMIPYPASWLNGERYYDEIIIDESHGLRVREVHAEKEKEKKEKKENEKKIQENKNKKISPVTLQIWRHAIKIEIISRFPNMWQSTAQSKFYYNARMRYYINNY